MEAILRAYRYDLGVPTIVLRIASVYGPGRTTDCFIRDLIRSAAAGTAIRLFDEGGFRRQIIHIDDVARGIVQSISAKFWNDFAYNIGGGEWLTERELAALAARILPRLQVAAVPAPCQVHRRLYGSARLQPGVSRFRLRTADRHKSGHRVLRRTSCRGSSLTDPKSKWQAFCLGLIAHI
jgi:nucleoside-diphosphate-sugar epimerase